VLEVGQHRLRRDLGSGRCSKVRAPSCRRGSVREVVWTGVTGVNSCGTRRDLGADSDVRRLGVGGSVSGRLGTAAREVEGVPGRGQGRDERKAGHREGCSVGGESDR
jgi:hypothetical protein